MNEPFHMETRPYQLEAIIKILEEKQASDISLISTQSTSYTRSLPLKLNYKHLNLFLSFDPESKQPNQQGRNQ